MKAVAKAFRPALDWAYRRPHLFPLGLDVLAWPVGLLFGAYAKLVFSSGVASGWELLVASTVAMAIQAGLGWMTGVYRHRWRVSSFDEMNALGLIWAITSLVLIVCNFAARSVGTNLSTSAVMMGSLIVLVLIGCSRVLWRRYWENNRRPNVDRCKRTVIFGAGEGAAQIIKAMLADADSEYFPIAMLDDDPQKSNRELDGVRVRGTRADLATVARATFAEAVLIAIPSADGNLIKDIAQRATEADLEVRVLPAASELVGGMTVADVRPPTVDDLLGRASVEIDLDSVADYIRGKRVLVTGAGGSIGSELSRQIRQFDPSELYLLDRDESALHGVQLSMEGRALLDSDMLVVADIRDRERIVEIFDRYRPEVVFHAAALKHLTLLENHPTEGVKTNILGTMHLLEASKTFGVGRFVNISTDKAADPTSVLGATKLAAERLTARAAAETGLPFVSVRFGNVLGSRGSVLPTFMNQLENGLPLTVTDPDVTRYFMTIPEAVTLVVQAGAIGDPGEVMVLDMGEPVKIVDLAQQLINSLAPGTPIEFTGLRPGEKMHEVLIGANEQGVTKQHPRITHTQGELGPPSEALSAVSTASLIRISEMLASTTDWDIVDA